MQKKWLKTRKDLCTTAHLYSTYMVFTQLNTRLQLQCGSMPSHNIETAVVFSCSFEDGCEHGTMGSNPICKC